MSPANDNEDEGSSRAEGDEARTDQGNEHKGSASDDEVKICRAKTAKEQQEYDRNYEKERLVIEGWYGEVVESEKIIERMEQYGINSKSLRQLSIRLYDGIQSYVGERALERRERLARYARRGSRR